MTVTEPAEPVIRTSCTRIELINARRYLPVATNMLVTTLGRVADEIMAGLPEASP